MSTVRAAFLICATIFASVFAIIFYGYQQDQYVVSSGGNFVSIFDRKTRTLNICDKGNCTLVNPVLESRHSMMHGAANLASHIMNPQHGHPPGARVLGSFPHQPGAHEDPMHQQQMMQQHQANPQMAGQPHAAAANQQMTPQQQQMMMQQQQQIMRQQEMMRQQQMMQQQQQQQQMNPQMVSGNAQGAQAQMTGGVGAQAAAEGAGEEPEEEAAPEEAAGTEEAAPAEEAEEESAPV